MNIQKYLNNPISDLIVGSAVALGDGGVQKFWTTAPAGIPAVISGAVLYGIGKAFIKGKGGDSMASAAAGAAGYSLGRAYLNPILALPISDYIGAGEDTITLPDGTVEKLDDPGMKAQLEAHHHRRGVGAYLNDSAYSPFDGF
jgi:hypothetical protein